MEVLKLSLGSLQTNCYIITNDLNECVIVDPGAESDKLINLIKEKEMNLKAILVTHGHFDHVGGVEGLVKEFGVDVYAHKAESDMMSDSGLNLSKAYNPRSIECKANKFLEDGDMLDLGNDFSFKVIEVPGHTSHSLCYLDLEGHLFSGDTLFNSAIGRTDLYDGNSMDLMVNIEEKLFVLDKDCVVYSGHGLSTTIGQELVTNPFFN